MEVVLQRDDNGFDGQLRLTRDERAFFKAGVARLRQQTALVKAVEIKWSTVTSLEVERGFLLGGDHTSTVRVGQWRGKLVGILELKDEEVIWIALTILRSCLYHLIDSEGRYRSEYEMLDAKLFY